MKSCAPTARAASSTSASDGVAPAVRDVLADRAGEQERLLRHDAEMRVVRDGVVFTHVDAVDEDLARSDVVEAGHDLEDRRLAGARLTYECHRLAGLDHQRHLTQRVVNAAVG